MSSNVSNPVPLWFDSLAGVHHPRLRKIVSTVQSPVTILPKWHTINDAAVQIIVGQMLSRSAANSIIARLYGELGSAREILVWSSKIKPRKPQHGLSVRKIRALAHWKTARGLKARHNKTLRPDYNSIKAHFANQWGFGPWSIDMLALFFFCCPNVWPRNDTTISRLTHRLFKSQYPRCIVGHESIVSICLWEMVDRKLFASTN